MKYLSRYDASIQDYFTKKHKVAFTDATKIFKKWLNIFTLANLPPKIVYRPVKTGANLWFVYNFKKYLQSEIGSILTAAESLDQGYTYTFDEAKNNLNVYRIVPIHKSHELVALFPQSATTNTINISKAQLANLKPYLKDTSDEGNRFVYTFDNLLLEVTATPNFNILYIL